MSVHEFVEKIIYSNQETVKLDTMKNLDHSKSASKCFLAFSPKSPAAFNRFSLFRIIQVFISHWLTRCKWQKLQLFSGTFRWVRVLTDFGPFCKSLNQFLWGKVMVLDLLSLSKHCSHMRYVPRTTCCSWKLSMDEKLWGLLVACGSSKWKACKKESMQDQAEKVRTAHGQIPSNLWFEWGCGNTGGLWNLMAWVPILALPFTNHLTVGAPLHLSELQGPHL